MAKEELKLIKESNITNNCPHCYNQDLKMSFFQKHIDTQFYHKVTNEISHKILCNTCNTPIYPVNWTDDIERIFAYYQKMVTPEKATVKYKQLFYVLVLLGVLVVAAAVYFYVQGAFTV